MGARGLRVAAPCGVRDPVPGQVEPPQVAALLSHPSPEAPADSLPHVRRGAGRARKRFLEILFVWLV